MEPLQLYPIPEDGQLPAFIKKDTLSRSFVDLAARIYKKKGFHPPWIWYVAVWDAKCVGTCALLKLAARGNVEIVYQTYLHQEGQDFDAAMARELVEIARRADPSVIVSATTLPDESASIAILKELGFRVTGEYQNPEAGTALEWELLPPRESRWRNN